MIRAKPNDRTVVVDMLTHAFGDNKSVNYIVKRDSRKAQRLKRLMEYSFDICLLFGEVFLSNDKKGCALVLLPDQKRTTLRSIFLDIKLLVSCVGFANIKKVLDREAAIKKLHPKKQMYYLWFIGVEPGFQNKGIGSELLQAVIKEGASINRPVYLETSVVENIAWYEKRGFEIYKELNFGFPLYCLKRE